MSRLWEFDEFGEPWLENGRKSNPPLLIVNSKKGKKMAAKKKVYRKKGRKAAPKRTAAKKHTHWGKVKSHRRRVNPWPMGGAVVGVNPHRKRRKSSHRRSNPKRRISHYKRNASILGVSLPPIQTVLYVGVGYIGTPMVEGFLNKFVPTAITGNTLGRYAVKIASAIGLSAVTRMVLGSSEARLVAVGGGVYVLTSAAAEFMPTTFGLKAYRPSTGQLQSYSSSTGRTFNQLAAPEWGARNTVRSAPMGAANIVGQRFRRFQ